MSENYIFELLCIDSTEKVKFKKPVNFIRNLYTIEVLWKDDPDIKEESLEICDSSQNIKISIQPFDTSKMATGNRFSSAYCLNVEGKLESVEPFRAKLLDQLEDLNFHERRILLDEVSNHIAIQIYPLINKIENVLRRYIIKFFITKIGTDWWSVTVPQHIIKSAQNRKSNEKTFSSSNRVTVDVTLLTFDQLGKLIYDESSAITKVEDIFAKIRDSNDLENLKKELLEGTYSKYFQDIFEKQDFSSKWKKLAFVRNKVAHNNYFSFKDLEETKDLVISLEELINNADKKIDEAVLSAFERQRILKKFEDIISTESDEDKLDNSEISDIDELGEDGIINSVSPRLDIHKNSISEEDLITQLKDCSEKMGFVGLKFFVKQHLGKQGYSFNSSYALINLLADNNIVEIYEVDNPHGEFKTSAIRLKDRDDVKEV